MGTAIMIPLNLGSELKDQNGQFTVTPDGQRLKVATHKLSSKSTIVPTEFTVKGTTPSGKPRLFVCAICTRAFARQEHLKRHERSHTKEKPFSCNICQRKFSRRDLLLRHSTKLHAGAADAVPRLRRRSVRARPAVKKQQQDKYHRQEAANGQQLVSDTSSADMNGAIDPELPYDSIDSLLHSRVDELQFPTNTMHRRASFSAMGGHNYAVADPEQNASQMVEFSTPQTAAKEGGFVPPFTLDDKPEEPSGYSFYDMPSHNYGTLFTHVNDPSRTLLSVTSSVVESSDGLDPKPDKRQSPPRSAQSRPKQVMSHEKVKSWQQTLFNQDINYLETITDLNVSKQFNVPQGYSFYGDEFSSLSSNATISPSLLDPHLDGRANSVNSSPAPNDSIASFLGPEASKRCSHASLFGPILRKQIFQTLSQYPFLGVSSPAIPKNETMNNYVDQFKFHFLNHFSFIHGSLLNEHSLLNSTIADIEPEFIRDSNLVTNVKHSFVCLPLLIATLGAVVSNNPRDAANLCEASRRCIHVYLESRKQLHLADSGSSTASPLWLIQALTLSVIYGLFADEDTTLNVVMRQVNALCSMIKASNLNEVSPSKVVDFNKFVRYESTVRTIHIVLHVTTLLCSLYNITPSLRLEDLRINLPCATVLWECTDTKQFVELHQEFEFKTQPFRETLQHLAANASPTYFTDHHISDFALVCLQNGYHQMHYYGQNLYDVVHRWDSMLSQYDTESNIHVNDSRVLNRYMLMKMNPVVDLRAVKEAIWLKDTVQANNQYYRNFLASDDKLKDINFQRGLLELVNNSVEILKLVYFNRDSTLVGSINPLSTNSSEMAKLADLADLGDDISNVNVNIGHKLSIDSQCLFDVFLVLSLYASTFEKMFRDKLNNQGLSSFSLLQHLELSSLVFNKESSQDDSHYMSMYKYYLRLFKVYSNLEEFLKVNYDYQDFEGEFCSLTITNLIKESANCVTADRDLITSELIQFKLPYRFLKLASFMHNYFYDKQFKFGVFRQLGEILFHMKIYLEGKEA